MPIIQDIAVVACTNQGIPIGEAFRPDVQETHHPLYPMMPDERESMLFRLKSSIYELMDESHRTFKANCKRPNTSEIDPEYMTRLSTNEFFFYTLEPLTLTEFEVLQNEIAKKAKTLPSGIQLILSSFAVKTADDHVMNVTPHITCGPQPDFNFLVKNYTSDIDVHYKLFGNIGPPLNILDINNINKLKSCLPSINVNGMVKEFTFYNLIRCQSPNGTPFLTAVDICLDHDYGVAKTNVEALCSSYPDMLNQYISQVVVSNSMKIMNYHSFDTHPMLADPYSSHCKKNVEQEVDEIQMLAFGNDAYVTYRLHRQALCTIKEAKVALSFAASLPPENTVRENFETYAGGTYKKLSDRILNSDRHDFFKFLEHIEVWKIGMKDILEITHPYLLPWLCDDDNDMYMLFKCLDNQQIRVLLPRLSDYPALIASFLRVFVPDSETRARIFDALSVSELSNILEHFFDKDIINQGASDVIDTCLTASSLNFCECSQDILFEVYNSYMSTFNFPEQLSVGKQITLAALIDAVISSYPVPRLLLQQLEFMEKALACCSNLHGNSSFQHVQESIQEMKQWEMKKIQSEMKDDIQNLRTPYHSESEKTYK